MHLAQFKPLVDLLAHTCIVEGEIKINKINAENCSMDPNREYTSAHIFVHKLLYQVFLSNIVKEAQFPYKSWRVT